MEMESDLKAMNKDIWRRYNLLLERSLPSKHLLNHKLGPILSSFFVNKNRDKRTSYLKRKKDNKIEV